MDVELYRTFLAVALVSGLSWATPQLIRLAQIDPFYAALPRRSLLGIGMPVLFRPPTRPRGARAPAADPPWPRRDGGPHVGGRGGCKVGCWGGGWRGGRHGVRRAGAAPRDRGPRGSRARATPAAPGGCPGLQRAGRCPPGAGAPCGSCCGTSAARRSSSRGATRAPPPASPVRAARTNAAPP